jgi:two-component system, OmpR family, alkaline phosphatase synthesis response regulator PhoP
MIPSETKILVVDDDPDIAEFLSYNLRREGYAVHLVNNGKDAIRLVPELSPHLILLDVMMPGMDGIETCEKIREDSKNEDVLIVFLTARSEDYSQLAGFSAGADDYITKPVKPKVLVSRLNALLRRYGTRPKQESDSRAAIKIDDLIIDPERYLVFKGDRELTLPRKEFKLLWLLTSKPSRVFTRDEIFDQIWGSDVFVGDRTIDVYIRKLREKIGDECIKTIKGVGYKFEG